MKKIIAMILVIGMFFSFVPSHVYAANTATHGKITGRSAVAGLTSVFLWPGIGQYLNHNETKKNWTHAIAGLFPPFRLWSGWDALINRQGGRWDGKI